MADRNALLAIPDKLGVIQPTQNWLGLRARITAHDPGLIVLDTSAAPYGDEIMRAQVRGFIGMLRALDLKRTPLLSHPAITGMQSGSSHCLGQLRTVAPLSDATDRRKRRPRTAHSDGEKANYGKSGDGITMRLGRRGVHSRQRLASLLRSS
jgi:hypothetical protein